MFGDHQNTNTGTAPVFDTVGIVEHNPMARRSNTGERLLPSKLAAKRPHRLEAFKFQAQTDGTTSNNCTAGAVQLGDGFVEYRNTGPIEIDLDAVGNPDFGTASNSFIQREARNRVLKALVRSAEPTGCEKSYSRNRPAALNVLPDRRHDSILISARRGEGKTTFLTSLLKALEDGDFNTLAKSELGEQVKIPTLYSLGIIDPTLIESKQNIMVVIIDRIRSATEYHRDQTGRDDGYQPVETALRALAQGLSLLDGIGESLYSGKNWIDPDFILDKGLEDAAAAHDFGRRFIQFAEEAALYLNVDAFVLAIDDVDTWFERGWPVLEALRKYLVTPKLRIILSGDLTLYSLLVRQQQWKQMGKEFLDAEEKRGEVKGAKSLIRKIGEMVDTLQDQYLVKVSPPENRVDLKRLHSYASDPKVGLTVRWARSETKPRVEEFLKKVCEAVFGLRYKPDVELVTRHILQLPTRSALQVLAAATEVHEPIASKSAALRAVEDALRHIAWTALMSVDLDIEKTRDPAPEEILGILGEWLTRAELWGKLARFHPDAVDDDMGNLVAIYLAAVLNGVFRQSPGRMVDFWLRVAILREKIDRGEVSGHDRIAALFRHLGADRIESSAQFVSRLAAWEAVEGGRDDTRGTISGVRLSGASVPLNRVREDNSAARELYGHEYNRDNSLDRELFRKASKSGDEAQRSSVLATLPPPLRGYHRALMQAGWSYDSKRRVEAGFQGYFVNGIEDLAGRLDPSARTVALLPVHRIISGQASESGNYSFLRILAVIAELVDLIVPSGDAPEDLLTTAGEIKASVENILRAAIQVRSFPTPHAVQALGVEDMVDLDETSQETEIVSDGDDLGEIVVAIIAWLQAHGKKGQLRPLAPIALSRIWTRFTFAFQNMRDDLKHLESRYLGVLMHRTVITFLHSVGFEALRAANIETRSSLAKNPVSSGEVFARLLAEIYDDKTDVFKATSEYAFFDLLFSCPVWGYFFARTEEDEVEEKRRETPNEAIFSYYQEQAAPFWKNKPPSWESVNLDFKGNTPTQFDGLFFPLNTVQLQGFSAQLGRSPKRSRAPATNSPPPSPQSSTPASGAGDPQTAGLRRTRRRRLNPEEGPTS